MKWFLNFFWFIGILILCISGSSAAINQISQGETVFIGESGLDISNTLSGVTQIAWWQPGTNTETEQPADIQQVTNPHSFYVTPYHFVGKTGNWYQWTGNSKGQIAFNIKQPLINLKIGDGTQNNDITGKSISRAIMPTS